MEKKEKKRNFINRNEIQHIEMFTEIKLEIQFETIEIEKPKRFFSFKKRNKENKISYKIKFLNHNDYTKQIEDYDYNYGLIPGGEPKTIYYNRVYIVKKKALEMYKNDVESYKIGHTSLDKVKDNIIQIKLNPFILIETTENKSETLDFESEKECKQNWVDLNFKIDNNKTDLIQL